MKRSTFIKALGFAGIGSLVPSTAARAKAAGAAEQAMADGVDCVLIPQETRGPYPLDLSSDTTKFRTDVTEGRPGLPLELTLTILNEVVLRALGVDQMRPMFYGAILILFILFLPNGLESLVAKTKDWIAERKHRRALAEQPAE